ncbi:hypothetical protein SALBM311S_12906 [Streptomyces alboniger]
MVSQVAGINHSSRTNTTTPTTAAAHPSISAHRPDAVLIALCNSSPISPNATPVTSVSTMFQKVCPASRVSTSSASVAYSARNNAVVSTASTPDPWNSSASTYEAYGTSSVSPICRVASSSSSINLLAPQPSTTPTATATTADSTRRARPSTARTRRSRQP